MRKVILSIAVILLGVTGLVQAEGNQLGATLDVTYLSKTIWRGFDYYADDHSSIQTSLDVDLYGSGFGVKVFWRRAISAPFENAEDLDVTLYYGGNLFEGEAHTTDYAVGWVYYGYPDEPRGGSSTGQAADMQEFFASFSWPKLCPRGFVPSYTVLTMWPSEGDSAVRKNSGWAHVLGLGYDLVLSDLVPNAPQQLLHLSAAVVYNDGVAPGVALSPSVSGSAIDHDWSHALFGISTDFDLGNSLMLTPAVYYQASWEDTVNSEDEAWASLSMKYKF